MVFIPVIAGHSALHGLPTVQPARLAALAHKNAVVVVDPHLGTEQFDHIGQGLRVIDKILASRSPQRDAAGAPQPVFLVFAGPRLVGQRVEFVYFGRGQDVFDD